MKRRGAERVTNIDDRRYFGRARVLSHAEHEVAAACRRYFYSIGFPANGLHYEAIHELAPAITAAINAAMDALGCGDTQDESWLEALRAMGNP